MSKKAIHDRVEAMAAEIFAVSDYIHANPELGLEEYKAQARLVEEFQGRGFTVEKGVGGFETAFKASFPSPKQGLPTVAFIAEYDALPDLGHACGHNLIAGTAFGAAGALLSLRDELMGNIVVIGTPAEEGVPSTRDLVLEKGVKGIMVDRGVFDGVDVAMMCHARDRTHTGGQLMAMDALEFQFRGKASHAAASPEKGVSALDAAVLTMHAIELLREHMRPSVRIHGIITDGGRAPNIVPEHAALRYYARALDRPYLNEVVARMENCARAGALATGAELTITRVGGTDNRLNVETLNRLLLDEARQAGAQRIMAPPSSFGSADFGNVSQAVSGATLYVEVTPEGTPGHSVEMEAAAGGDPGRRALLIGAKAMASTAYELLADPGLLAQVKQEFADAKRLQS